MSDWMWFALWFCIGFVSCGCVWLWLEIRSARMSPQSWNCDDYGGALEGALNMELQDINGSGK